MDEDDTRSGPKAYHGFSAKASGNRVRLRKGALTDKTIGHSMGAADISAAPSSSPIA